jgi:hypothetical protein
MNKVQDKATLDEKTVQKIARGETKVTRKRKPRTRKPSSMVQPTYESPLVSSELWAAAKKILDSPHGYTRWEIPEENVVIVR